MSWEENLVQDRERIQELLTNSHVIAVLGMEKEENSGRPAYYVADYLRKHGFEIIPLPVKYPGMSEVAGLKAYHALVDVPGEIDIVDVFRSPRDINKHVDDILAKTPKAVWFQSGIRNDAAAEKFARAGIKVVQDHCMKAEHMLIERQRRA
jgi:predicted CoA-binding protein